MKSATLLAAGFSLAACLAATPARADLAGAADASGLTTTLQSLTVILDAAATLTPAAGLSGQLVSSGPASQPSASLGVDSANIPPFSGAATGSAGDSLSGFSAGAVQLPSLAEAASLSAATPVGAAAPPSTDLSSMSGSVSAPLNAPLAVVVPPVIPAVPIPSAFLLMGGGLLGLLPLRRVSGYTLG
jgi:hypothetical protein